jgi:hypothetical protein
VQQVSAGTRDLRIELDTRAPTQRVRGRIVDIAGQAVADVRMSVTVSMSDRDRFTAPEVRTGADGTFDFVSIRGEVVEIVASLDPRQTIVEPKPGDVLDDLTITLGRMCAIQIDSTANPGSVTKFEVHDARSGPVRIYQSTSTVGKDGGDGGRSAQRRRSISAGLSDVFTVMEGDLTAVFFRGTEEVGRVPIVLASEGLTIVRL